MSHSVRDAETRDAADSEGTCPFRLFVEEPEVGEALQKGPNGDLPLQTRERSPQTEMNAVAKSEMVCRVARNVEFVGVRVLGRVAVGGSQKADHDLASLDLGAGERYVHLGYAPGGLHGAGVTEELVDGGREQRRGGSEPFHLVRVAE